jgi:RNA polymerase sigma-70 factor (ECF subfamily)
MSALPTTLTLQPLPQPNLSGITKKRVSLTASHRPGTYQGQGASPTGVENLGTDFASVYRTYRRRVYSQCFCMLRNQSDAEDASQEVFLQLFRKAHTFRGESSFSTWLQRLTINCALMEIRRKRRRLLEATPPEASHGAGMGSDVFDSVLDTFQAPATPVIDRISIGHAVSQLPTGYQRIFHLHDVEGYTHDEIASLLGIQVGTSKSQLHKARLRMRELLQTGGGAAEKQQLN